MNNEDFTRKYPIFFAIAKQGGLLRDKPRANGEKQLGLYVKKDDKKATIHYQSISDKGELIDPTSNVIRDWCLPLISKQDGILWLKSVRYKDFKTVFGDCEVLLARNENILLYDCSIKTLDKILSDIKVFKDKLYVALTVLDETDHFTNYNITTLQGSVSYLDWLSMQRIDTLEFQSDENLKKYKQEMGRELIEKNHYWGKLKKEKKKPTSRMYPTDYLPSDLKFLGALIKQAQKASQGAMSEASIATIMLGMISLCSQNHLHFVDSGVFGSDDGERDCSMYCIVVAPSGQGKSQTIDLLAKDIINVVRSENSQRQKDLRKEKERLEAEIRKDEQRKDKIAGGNVVKENETATLNINQKSLDNSDRLMQVEQELSKLHFGLQTSAMMTSEGLRDFVHDNVIGGVVIDEGSRFFDKKASSASNMSTLLTEVYDGSMPVAMTRIERAKNTVKGEANYQDVEFKPYVRFSAVIGIQPIYFNNIFFDPDFSEGGFIGRILATFVEPIDYNQDVKIMDYRPIKQMTEYQKYFNVCKKMLLCREHTIKVELSQEIEDVFTSFYKSITKRLGSNHPDYELYRNSGLDTSVKRASQKAKRLFVALYVFMWRSVEYDGCPPEFTSRHDDLLKLARFCVDVITCKIQELQDYVGLGGHADGDLDVIIKKVPELYRQSDDDELVNGYLSTAKILKKKIPHRKITIRELIPHLEVLAELNYLKIHKKGNKTLVEPNPEWLNAY